MDHLMKFGWSVIGSLCMLSGAVLRLFGEIIRIIGVGLFCAGEKLIGVSKLLSDKAHNWYTKEPVGDPSEEEKVESDFSESVEE